jgi:hypothetical protein
VTIATRSSNSMHVSPGSALAPVGP